MSIPRYFFIKLWLLNIRLPGHFVFCCKDGIACAFLDFFAALRWECGFCLLPTSIYIFFGCLSAYVGLSYGGLQEGLSV
jgi:hypothetical protein